MNRLAAILALVAASLLLVAAIGKTAELGQLAFTIGNNFRLPDWIAPHLAAGVVLWELVLAGWLFSAPERRTPALAASATLLVFGLVKGYWMYATEAPTCHCLGAVADTSSIAGYFLTSQVALGVVLLTVGCLPRSPSASAI